MLCSIATPVSDQYAGDGIAARGPAFGIPTLRVDGHDPVAVYNATKAARELIIAEKTPVLLELMTYRVGHHSTSDDSSTYRAESAQEVAAEKAKGPIPRLRAYLEAEGVWDAAKDAALHEEAARAIAETFAKGEKKKRPPLRDMFTDTFEEMPWHLEEQWQYLEKHVRAYPEDYDLTAGHTPASQIPVRGLDGPVPAGGPSECRNGRLGL